MRMTKTTIIERDGVEIEVEVEFDATPLIPATWDDPAEGGEIELSEVTVGGEPIDPPLTDAEAEKLETWCAENLEYADFDDGPDPDDLRDARRDDLLTGGGQ